MLKSSAGPVAPGLRSGRPKFDARSTARKPDGRSLSAAPGSNRAEGLVALVWLTVVKP